MEFIIGIILGIIALIIISLIMRKQVYDAVDRLESWKLDIMNRNVSAQLRRIKSLNLSGETQERFESWKERWEFILAKDLPEIEEYLFDAEGAADKFRFSTAKHTLRKIDQNLQTIEKDIEKILIELDELVESEESSRKEVEYIEPTIRTLKKNIAQNRFQFGKAEVRFEVELDELDEGLEQYNELVDTGNYTEAKELVDTLKARLEQLEIEIEEFPEIYRICKQELPSQIDDLYAGIKEMKESGFRIEHLGFEKELQGYQQRLLDCVNSLEKGQSSEVKELTVEIEERIQEMYQLLEKEAIAKNYMETKVSGYGQSIQEIAASFDETKNEVERLKYTYYFDDQDMEKFLALEKNITQLQKVYEEVRVGLEEKETPYSELRDILELGLNKLNEIVEEHNDFKTSVNNLRKDEIEAKEKLTDIREQINNTHRKINKSNIPGVPSFIWNSMDEALEKSNQVLISLEKSPLDISEVRKSLESAKAAVDLLMEKTDVMLDQAYLTEQVIQYANRYRSMYPLLAAKLSEAETLFRNYEYEVALEQAARALEEVEPGALKRIEENQLILK
ncbi:septation ring formation regulator EzrA [Ornithinibacillus halotolerans]|uniref:Septation ring formation regulator EzrA n=1 Tax=Ornithinibacillus halotolerans TaxID=1274357 RepID=A0A916WAU9_9BACI|nr:septation ring formation regulator EzrA [Ornithinibacillus halotolerans]GGA82256.1 septation ring formation regulator EzrA [Ornithinibacillus halotolerans]